MSVWVAVALLVSLLTSCGKDKPANHFGDSRYVRLDSLMNTITDVDSIDGLARQSHERNDLQAEMLAYRRKGNLMNMQARYIDASIAHRKSVELATVSGDTIGKALSLCYLGDDYRRQGELSQAYGCCCKVLQLCDDYSLHDSRDIVETRALALNYLGNIEIDLKNYVMADTVLRVALSYEKQLDNNIGIARNYGGLGRVKREIGELDSAWFCIHKSLEYNKLSGIKQGEAMCHLHFGELYESDKKYYHAIEEYKLAYDMLKESGNSWQWVNACLSLARVHVLLGEVDTASSYLDEADAESRRIGSRPLRAECHLQHYELLLLQGDHKGALEHYVSGVELMDSVFGRQQSEEIRSQYNEYQTGRMSGEMTSLVRDIDRLKHLRNIQRVLLLLLLLMASAIIAALVYAMRVRSRTQKLMNQVEETRSLFFTNVVHQLRTPLSAIMGAIDSIVDDSKANGADSVYSESQRENCEIIERQGNNLLDLMDRILEVGSVRSTITELDWRKCDVVTFIHMVLESYRDRCLERHIELTYVPRENNVEIDTVPRYLNTIVSSLIENAINYSNEFGKITVTSHVDDGMFIIRVADNGMGISKDDLPHVFEPFYRSASAEAVIDGVGIGLTVVRDMTMAMGGVVAADSMKDCGAVFTVKLPCHQVQGLKQRFDAAVEPLVGKTRRQQRFRQNPGDALTPAAGGLPVVLVVEDHLDVAHLVGHVLGKGYNVQYASDGEQGLAKAEKLVPDLIITDVKMPLLDGLEMCRALRGQPHLCHIPVIMLSARNSDSDRVKGVEAGADAYLVKPFVTEELRAWVTRLLENHRMLRDKYATPGASETPVDETSLGQSAADAEDTARFLQKFSREVELQLEGGGKINFDKLAHAFKMGESQLRRKVQELTGKSVPAYIGQVRMEKAMRLLQSSDPDVLISTISEQCGFQDVAYFSRVFRQYYGMTPTQARTSK